MAMTKLTPSEYQQLLIDNGFDLGVSGADGVWGARSSRASEQWFGLGTDLLHPRVPPPAEAGVVPASWLPDCEMERVIGHWSAGSYTVSEVDKEHYHIIVGGDLKLVRGENSIKSNVSTRDADGYAAHTLGCNTGSIGIAVACMANAVESPFNAGTYPMTEAQWLTLAAVAADCCRKYNIKVTPRTVLTHAEVEKTLGIRQRQKWDIAKAPWNPSLSSAKLNDMWRAEVQARV
jgi:hypothetical protein